MKAPTVSLEDAIAELERELAVRRAVYPRWIEAGRLERDVAGDHYRRMSYALHALRRLKRCALSGVCLNGADAGEPEAAA